MIFKDCSLCKRYMLFVLSLFLQALGVAIMRKGNMGISPMSSVANVMSINFDFISFGTWLIFWNCLMILGQIFLLRKDFRMFQFLQLPLSILFGRFVDFAGALVNDLFVESYLGRLLVVLVGICILAIGVSLAVIANVILNSGEAFVKAVADITYKDFGLVKVVVDVGCVVLAIILSIFFFDFQIVGVREGTIIVASTTGLMVRFFIKRIRKPIEYLIR